jgi:N-acetyl-gamma-glutamyl-phosphate reductase
MSKVFIDGKAGTTGLRIYDRLAGRKDIELITLSDAQRKDTDARLNAIAASDITFLCLPDAAALEIAALAQESDTILIDTSTAHRTNPAWCYGFPELREQRERILSSKRIANPGCHASGFIALAAPLVSEGVLPKEALLSCTSLTGYSGGGNAMIASYENPKTADSLVAPRMYGLTQTHKHLPEMKYFIGLQNAPIFCPIVSSYYAGMEVTIPLFAADIKGTDQEIKEIYKTYYRGGLIRYRENPSENGFLSAQAFAGRDDMEISVYGNEERILLVARFDNLGKGASGSAIQNMNLLLGLDETTGLTIGGIEA